MKLIGPPFSKTKISAVLFEKIHKIQEQALKVPKEKCGVLRHLIDLNEAYSYIYYVHIVDKTLKKRKGLIVDWGGFCGQITILLNSLGYDCENYVLYYPSQKHLFDKFNIKYQLDPNPKKMPYKSNSCLALISSGVLEHVLEEGVTDKESLKEIYRVLKPGGYFFCWNLPRRFALVELIARLRNKSVHPVKYTSSGFKKLLNEVGFQIDFLNIHGDVLKIGGLRKLLCKFGPWRGFVIDYYASQIPLVNLFSHHIIAIAKKPY